MLTLVALYVMAIFGVAKSTGDVWKNVLRQCANCLIFMWRQPDDLNTLLQCSRCKVVLYCDKACQREHWKLVHRQHCRKLAEAKAEEQKEISLSVKHSVGIYSQHPFSIEGLPGDIHEGLIMAVEKIINQMKSSRHPAYRALEIEMKILEIGIIHGRRRIWCRRKLFPSSLKALLLSLFMHTQLKCRPKITFEPFDS